MALIVAAVLIAGQASRGRDGAVDEAGTMAAGSLRVGDCFEGPTEHVEISTIDAIPCDQPHGAELYFTHISEDPEGTPFPGDQTMEDRAGFVCAAHFEGFVGRAWAESALSFGVLFPVERSWDDGDRVISCYVLRADRAPMTGSVKGSGI